MWPLGLGTRAPAAQPIEPNKVRRRSNFYGEIDDEKPRKSNGERVTLEPDVSEVRRIRLEKLEGGRSTSKSTRKSTSDPRVTSESNATLETSKSSSSHHRRRRHDRSEETPPKDEGLGRHRSRSKTNQPKEEKTRSAYVYGNPKDRDKKDGTRGVRVTEKRRNKDDDSSDSEEERDSKLEPMDKTRKIKVVYREAPKGSSASTRAKTDEKTSKRSVDNVTPLSRNTTTRKSKATGPDTVSRPPLSRSATVRMPPPEAAPISRRNSITSTTSTSKHKATPSLANTSISTNTHKSRPSAGGGFLSSFFGSAPPPPSSAAEPEKLVECLTCLSDDIPKSKCAKLQCGHRMCHSCLKRIFKLSVKDPQHMPPKCCTAEHIPLKHVEKLFDINFKRLWNKKYQEFTTKNRIYCPAKKCGEWIRPADMHKENGKKYGICSRCKTKVCGLCSGKWHGAKDCPKDEETKKLLQTAKEAGWQRCYDCRTMVELKEGCNHMTCHCTAQFCMICGLKWKTCNCPWFNYDAVEADRLDHMQVPAPVVREANAAPRPPVRLRRQRPNNYNDEMNERRRQERRDADLARRMQNGGVAVDDDDNDIGEIHGIGNAAGNFMNEDYVREVPAVIAAPLGYAAAAANFFMGGGSRPRPANPPAADMAERYPAVPQPPGGTPASPTATPLVRRHTTRDTPRSGHTRRASDLLLPRRNRTYEAEAAIHSPVTRTSSSKTSTSKSSKPTPAPKTSVLAGLGSSEKGNGRVNAWRNYVARGAPPEAAS